MINKATQESYSTMAGASQKKIAASNTKALKEIHILSGAINAIAIIAVFLLKRPANYKPFVILSIPLAFSQFTIEKSGRPVYGSDGRLVKTAIDLSQEGLTEYLFDIVYFTLIEDILMVLFGSNKVWWLFVAIPVFAIYKAWGILKYGKSLLGGFGGGAGGAGSLPDANGELDQQQQGGVGVPGKSKRQAKLEARAQKGGKRKVIR